MRNKIPPIFACVAIASVSFFFGKWRGDGQATQKHIEEEMRHWDQLASSDEAVLQNISTRSNTMTSGTYLMQICFPNLQLGTQEVILKIENGQITAPRFSRSGGSSILKTKGNVVSWTQEGAGYEYDAKYVGILDGDGMWGRVYGWNFGDQSVGLWRIYPKPIQPVK